MLDSSARPSPTPSMAYRSALLDALRDGSPIEAPTCVVVAHPDDETIALGARLAGFRSLALIHLTDGAPQDPHDAQQAGFGDATAYAWARAAELDRALAILGVEPRATRLALRDQSAVHHLGWLVRALAPRLAGHAFVLTHAYEGGHPDHDAAAFAVQAACAVLRRTGRPAPVRLEFAGYHLAEGRRVAGSFWPDPRHPAVTARIGPDQGRRKRRALEAFRSQAEVIAWFDPDMEAYRRAPTYDFTRLPPPGAALYDQWGWDLTSESWQALAVAALAELGDAAWA